MTTVVAAFALGLSLLLAIACGFLLTRARTLGRITADLSRRLAAVPVSEAVPVTVPAGRRLITVEILNPLEVAGRESRAGGLVGTLAPSLVTRIVYDQASQQILDGLSAEGVDAQVQVRVG